MSGFANAPTEADWRKGQPMDSECHLFVIWEKARSVAKRILDDLNRKFEILKAYEIKWSARHFSSNMSRFYGENLPDGSFKEKHCGVGPFIAVIVRDSKPTCRKRATSRGIRQVNVNMFDAKSSYRAMTGGGHRIHATNTPEEFRHDLALLFGHDEDTFRSISKSPWDGRIEGIEKDLAGADGWETIGHLFSILNLTTNYVVLRNFECLPSQYNMESHGDIDLLTDNYNEMCYVTNAREVFRSQFRVLNKVSISDEDILFDFRYVGDGYYDKRWEELILDRKVLSDKGFFVPSETDYFYSLLYHAAVHKPNIKEDYISRLLEYGHQLGIENFNEQTMRDPVSLKGFLDDYLDRTGFHYEKPVDLSVFINKMIVEGENLPDKSMGDSKIESFRSENGANRLPLSEFNLNDELGVFIHPEKSEPIRGRRKHDYEYVLHSLEEVQKIKAFTPELFRFIKDTASEYHLSPKRVNLMEAVKDVLDKSLSVLEIGSGTGAITRWLGENFNRVDAIEADPALSAITRHRTKDLENVSVFCGDALDVDFGKGKYGLVTLIGGFESVSSGECTETSQVNNPEAFLNNLHTSMADNGLLFLAVDNKLGLNRLTGYGEENHEPALVDDTNARADMSFSRSELEDLLNACGFHHHRFYHLFPDYRLPETIIRECGDVLSLYPYNWINAPFIDSLGKQISIIPEVLWLKSITEAKLLWYFSNSFLVLASRSGDVELDTEWLIKKLCIQETPSPPFFSRVVTLVNDRDKGYVVKREPAQSGCENAKMKNVEYGFQRENTFVTGDCLRIEINEALLSVDYEEKLTSIMKRLHDSVMLGYFTGKVDPEGYPLVSGEAVDYVYNNIISSRDHTYQFIDKKWKFACPIPVDFVLFRNLNIVFTAFRSYICENDRMKFVCQIIRKIYPGFDYERMARGVYFEKVFQTESNHEIIQKKWTSIPLYSLGQFVQTKESELQQKDLLISKLENAVKSCERILHNVSRHKEKRQIALLSFQKIVERLKEEDISPELSVKVGEVCFENDNVENARLFFENALKEGRENDLALNNLGVVSVHAGDHERAEEYFRRALRANPQNEDARKNLGVLLGGGDQHERLNEDARP